MLPSFHLPMGTTVCTNQSSYQNLQNCQCNLIFYNVPFSYILLCHITKIKVKVSLVLRVIKIFEARAKTDTDFRNYNNKSVDVLFVSYNWQKEGTRYFEQKKGMVLYKIQFSFLLPVEQ